MCRAYTKPIVGDANAAGAPADADDFGQFLDEFGLYGLEGDAVLPKDESGESFLAAAGCLESTDCRKGGGEERCRTNQVSEKAFPREGDPRLATTPSPARRPAQDPFADGF